MLKKRPFSNSIENIRKSHPVIAKKAHIYNNNGLDNLTSQLIKLKKAKDNL